MIATLIASYRISTPMARIHEPIVEIPL